MISQLQAAFSNWTIHFEQSSLNIAVWIVKSEQLSLNSSVENFQLENKNAEIPRFLTQNSHINLKLIKSNFGNQTGGFLSD